MLRRLTVYIILSCLMIAGVQAQQAKKPFFKFGLGLIGAAYQGDLTDDATFLHRVRPGGQFTSYFNSSKFIQPEFSLSFGTFADQSDSIKPLSSGTDLIQANTFVETSFFTGELKLGFHPLANRRFDPYLSVGAGLFIFNPKDADGNSLGENIFTRLEEEELYNTVIPSLPASVGFNIKVNKLLAMGVGYTYRLTPSDYLDNIGMLGPRSGNDALHTVQMSLIFDIYAPDIDTIQIEKPKVKPIDTLLVASELPIKPDPVIKAEELPTDSSALAAKLEEVDRELTNQQLTDEFINRTNQFPKVILTEAPPLPEGLDVLSIDWIATEERSLKYRRFVYLQIPGEIDVREVAEAFHVRLETIQKINFMVNTDLYGGVLLRLPDMRNPILKRFSKNANGDSTVTTINYDPKKVKPNKPKAKNKTPKPQVKESPKVSSKPPPEPPKPPTQMSDQDREEYAIANSMYIYYQVKEGEEIDDIAKKFKVRKSTIKRLNFLVRSKIEVGTYLRLPDVGIPAD